MFSQNFLIAHDLTALSPDQGIFYLGFPDVFYCIVRLGVAKSTRSDISFNYVIYGGMCESTWLFTGVSNDVEF